MMYKDAVKKSMESLAKDEKTIFIGYNIARGSQAYGTLKEIPAEKKIETPVAENLMTGLAIGMSLEGFKPVLFFERHDFMLIALDGLLNHLDKIEKMSDSQYKPKVIIRATVGSNKPVDNGPQHTQDFSQQFKEFFNFNVYEPKTAQEVLEAYEKAVNSDTSTMIIERKELWDCE